MGIILFIFLFLHGAVHLLYAGHSKRMFEMAPDMMWPEESRVLSRFPKETIRSWAVILLLTADLAFTASAVGVLLQTGWWQLALIAAAILSSAVFFVFWDGKFEKMANQGAVGILVNISLTVLALLWSWIGAMSS